VTVVEPSVSTTGSLRTSARRRDMRNTPSASETVTTAGSPSGTAATARLPEVMNNSKGFVPRSNPSPNSSATMPSAAPKNQSRIIKLHDDLPGFHER
jgi:hypothetical protein